MPVAALSDPHMGDAAREPGPGREASSPSSSWWPSSSSPDSGAAYWQNWNPWIFGGTARCRSVPPRLRADGLGQVPHAAGPLRRGAPRPGLHHPRSATPCRRPWSSARPSWSSGARCWAACSPSGAGDLRRSWPLSRCCAPSARCPGTSLETHRLAQGDGPGRLQRSSGAQGHPGGRRDHDRLPQGTVSPQTGFITESGQAIDQTVLIRVSDSDPS